MALAVVSTAAPPPTPPEDIPLLYLTWHAPYGDPRARTELSVDCRDMSGVDTLYLTFETRHRSMRFTGMSGTLVFEPQAGDTLGRYWFRARGEANEAMTFVDFDLLLNSAYVDSPWEQLVAGSVGFTHVGGRGRLDVSAHVAPKQAKNLFPGTRYVFSRVKLLRSRGGLPGCDQPMSIAWVGACAYSSLGERMWVPPGPGRRVTLNANGDGVATRRYRPVAAWLPRYAPPSWRTVEVGFEPMRTTPDSTYEPRH